MREYNPAPANPPDNLGSKDLLENRAKTPAILPHRPRRDDEGPRYNEEPIKENFMTRTALTLVAGLALAPLAASAQPRDPSAALRGQIQALQAGGFSGMAEVRMPVAPAPARALPISVQTDETAEALAALILAARTDANLIADSIRALGFDVIGDAFPAKGIEKQPSSQGNRYFDVTTVRGRTEIIIQEFNKARQELRAYLITPDGSLAAAAVTKKINGKFQSEKISVSEAQAGCRELLEFWTRYYRENLKKP
jgi:hypothetical protein